MNSYVYNLKHHRWTEMDQVTPWSIPVVFLVFTTSLLFVVCFFTVLWKML